MITHFRNLLQPAVKIWSERALSSKYFLLHTKCLSMCDSLAWSVSVSMRLWSIHTIEKLCEISLCKFHILHYSDKTKITALWYFFIVLFMLKEVLMFNEFELYIIRQSLSSFRSNITCCHKADQWEAHCSQTYITSRHMPLQHYKTSGIEGAA